MDKSFMDSSLLIDYVVIKTTFRPFYFMRHAQFYALAIFVMYRLCPPVGVILNLRDRRQACLLVLSRRLRLRAPLGAKACV